MCVCRDYVERGRLVACASRGGFVHLRGYNLPGFVEPLLYPLPPDMMCGR
jgi:hypothetical protein